MTSRRRWLRWAIVGLAGHGLSFPARAGAQLEEPLVDSVRTALSSAIANAAPPVPEFASDASRLANSRWLRAMDSRLQRYKPRPEVREEFLQTLWYESRRAGLETSLTLGLIEVGRAWLHAGDAVLEPRDW